MMRRSLVALLVLGFVAGCGQAPPEPAHPAERVHTVASEASSGFNSTDRAWLQLMIPMHEQALGVLELVPARSPDPATSRLGQQVAATLRTELEQLRALRTRAGLPATNVHEGHDLPGLVTAEELRAVEQARAAALGPLVTARLREHFQQSIVLCRGERTSGADQPTKTLSAAIERARATQLAQLP